jgi:hypothetical protein
MTEYYIAFVQNKNRFNPFARLIEIVEKRETSHVEIVKVTDYKTDEAIAWGSVFPKSRKISLIELKKHYKVERMVPLKTKYPDSSCELILDSLCGKPYSFTQVILTGIKILTKGSLSKLNLVKPNLSKYLICTELAGIFMQEACGYRFDKSPEFLSLDEIEKIALSNLLKDD